MCGILAIILNILKGGKRENILSPAEAGFYSLIKRGPDMGNKYVNEAGMFFFRRLAINDLTKSGMQPFIRGEIVVMCNGEIYNHNKLKQKYNIQTVSNSDCECILDLYILLGFEKMIEELEGIYAIVISDYDANILYFATDNVGVRPLFYGVTEYENIVIGSTAESLSKFNFNKNNITLMRPGIMSYNFDTSSFSFIPHKEGIHAYEFHKEQRINKLLTKAVKRQLVSDRPIGCMLSGGLDSSLICSILCKLIGASNVRTYSIGMEGSTDLKYARLMADKLGTNHTEVLFTPEEGLAVIPYVVQDLESYDITTIRASVGMWLLAKYISENTDDKVIFSGEGADEIFCGYLYFHYAPSCTDLEEESKRLVSNLYKYDVLRADRCVSSHGVELRVPFLDKKFLNFCMSIPGESRAPKDGIEKNILRKAFEDDYLPSQILWRRKEGYSDGVSSLTKSWCVYIREHVNTLISDEEYSAVSFKFPSKESYYYKKLFDSYFTNYKLDLEYWMPKWIECNGDPSGRILNIFSEKIIVT